MKPLLFLLLLCFSPSAFAESPRLRLAKTLNLIEKGNFQEGSKRLYSLSRKKSLRSKKVQIKYVLGIAFTQMGFYHMASVQFLYVIKSNHRAYRKKAIEKLVEIADFLGDKDFIFYVLTKAPVRSFPPHLRSKMYFYMGLMERGRDRPGKSRLYFARVSRTGPFYNRALYHRALSYAEEGKPEQAASVFQNLSSMRKGVTDPVRVAALIGEARALYQARKFQRALEVYRSVPRDTKYWYEALLESGWAYLRAARFRSALSNFQTLHSSFYEGWYQPESLILRAYVYLYICKYHEMEKVLDLFNSSYLPSLKSVQRILKSRSGFLSYLNHVLQSASPLSSSVPAVVTSRIERHSEFQNIKSYLFKLRSEQARLRSMPYLWIESYVGRNTASILRLRTRAVKKKAAKLVRSILVEVEKELKGLTRQEAYLRYDMLRGKRESVKKRIRVKGQKALRIDEKLSRDYYIKNGYEYWPFKGENWLDELGNYHYIGLHSCD